MNAQRRDPYVRDSSSMVPPEVHLCTEPRCGREFQRASDLKRHQHTHRRDREDVKLKCPFFGAGCAYRALQQTRMDAHVASVHNNLRAFQCIDDPTCTFSTASPGSFTRHRKEKHGYVPPVALTSIRKQRPTPKPAPYAGPSFIPLSTINFSKQLRRATQAIESGGQTIKLLPLPFFPPTLLYEPHPTPLFFPFPGYACDDVSHSAVDLGLPLQYADSFEDSHGLCSDWLKSEMI